MDVKELEFFKSMINSNTIKASNGGVVLLGFIDETKQKIIEMSCKNKDVKVIFDGGFGNAEYKRALFMPVDYSNYSFKIKVYEIIYNKKYLKPNHRMILGTLMSLGIKRDSIGDIYINDDGKVYFACTKEISPYLVENFKSLGKISVELEEKDELVFISKKTLDKTKFLASMRLDVVLASAYNLSRSESLEMIKSGLVSVNHLPGLNPSLLLKEGDLLSVRHKGRVFISSIGGNTKSDRIIVQLSYYI